MSPNFYVSEPFARALALDIASALVEETGHEGKANVLDFAESFTSFIMDGEASFEHNFGDQLAAEIDEMLRENGFIQ